VLVDLGYLPRYRDKPDVIQNVSDTVRRGLNSVTDLRVCDADPECKTGTKIHETNSECKDLEVSGPTI